MNSNSAFWTAIVFVILLALLANTADQNGQAIVPQSEINQAFFDH